MPHALIMYASKHGHTGKIAARLADSMRAEGIEADVHDAGSPRSPSGYDGVVVGASIHAGHYDGSVLDWARENAAVLSAMPSAFFSVSLAAADEHDESQAQAGEYAAQFVSETGWTPRTTTSFAGALQYREYDFMTRLIMRLIAKHHGQPTDTSRDFDYTDWDAVERFGREFAASVGAGSEVQA